MRKLANEELGRKSVEEFKMSSKTPVIIVLDNVRSLNNVGSVFRTADAFLVEAVYLCGITGTPPNKEIQKTALGATESVAWKHFPSTLDAVKELKNENYIVYAIEQAESAIMLNNFMPSKKQKIAIIFGNEVKGVEQDVIDASTDVIEIPQLGTKHSLNISVSVGVVMWDLFLKLGP
ncbi:MAG: RNA methyltransferase [Bacteroidetes bacterium]|nr:RNA methyltransferase [Bacteroidota bacterium]